MKRIKKIPALILCLSMILSGCASDTTTISVDEQSSSNQSSVQEEGSSSSEDEQSGAQSGESESESSQTATTESSQTTTTSKPESSQTTTTTSKPESSQTTTTTSEPTSSQTTTTSKNEEKPQSNVNTATSAATTASKPEKLTDFSVEWKLSSTWQDGSNYCGGYEVTITNNTGKNIESWTAQITVPSGFKVTSGWNGIYDIKGTTMTVKNESYNGAVQAGGKTGFGFNYSSPVEFKPSKVVINGSNASASNGSSGNSSENNSGNNSGNNSTTTPKKTQQTVPQAKPDPAGKTPVSVHGQLSVKGTQLVDKNGKGYQLRGMSTHGLTWFPEFVNENAFKTLRDDWNTNVIRLAMYVDEWNNGLCYKNNKQQSIQLLEKGVDIAIKLDMYVIIDWHILNPGNPSSYTNDAIEFFKSVSAKYKNYPNIIYEICNEPNGGVSWNNDVKPYAEKVIPVIRKNDPDAVIIVGTPTWSQDIDQAMNNPLKYKNIMYALHFYAATHTDWLRQRLESCNAAGLPVMVTEFGCCDASGGGSNDFNQTKQWLTLLDRLGISYMNWSICNKAETCSALKPGASANGNWSTSDLSENGAWIRKWFRGEIN